MTDLVVVSLERWDDVWRRNQHLVDGLLRDDETLRVLFVEPAADPLHDALSRRAPSAGRRPAPLGSTGRLWTYRPVKVLPRRIDARGDDRLAHAITRAARGVGFSSPLLWINDPGMATVMDSSGWPTLYDITDDWLTADRPAAELERLARGEAALLERAAEVVACSPELVRRKSTGRPRQRHPIVLIRNAVDVAAYRTPRRRPADLTSPSALYVGTLHTDRLDVDLCIRTAAMLSDRGTLVLVGPNALSAVNTERLRAAGVRMLGPRPHEDVIAYLQHADVLVVPHLVTPFTESLDPIKLYEYAAVDRPIVATPVAGFRDTEGLLISTATGDEFSSEISVAFKNGPRIGAKVRVPDWADRVASVRRVLGRLV